MYTIAICDDNVKFSGELERMLMNIAAHECIKLDIDVLLDGAELIESVCQDKRRYDIIFLDIEMKTDGMTAAKAIREVDPAVLLIYVTSYDKYALEAYEVQPFQFLLKPLDADILLRYFKKAHEKLIQDPQYYYFKCGNDTYKIYISEIMYFQSHKRIIKIHMADGTVVSYYDKLNNIEARLKNGKQDFWRIHQSRLLNASYIYRISYDEVELRNKEHLCISEDRRRKISELYCTKVEDDIIR